MESLFFTFREREGGTDQALAIIYPMRKSPKGFCVLYIKTPKKYKKDLTRKTKGIQ